MAVERVRCLQPVFLQFLAFAVCVRCNFARQSVFAQQFLRFFCSWIFSAVSHHPRTDVFFKRRPQFNSNPPDILRTCARLCASFYVSLKLLRRNPSSFLLNLSDSVFLKIGALLLYTVSVVQRSFCDFNRVFLKAETERFERVIELIEFCGIVLVGRRFGITHEQRTPRER